MKIIIFCLILLFDCFLLAGYKSNADILNNLQMKKITDWGYACGGKCSFNWSGKSQVDLILSKDNSVVLTDTGTMNELANYPDRSRLLPRKWKFVSAGKWQKSRGEIRLTLQYKSINYKPTKKGDLTLYKYTIICKRDTVPVQDNKKQINESVLKCSPGKGKNNRMYAGTEFPWIFGLEKKILTTLSGEPEPTSKYSYY